MKYDVNKFYIDNDLKLRLTIHFMDDGSILSINVTDGLNSVDYDETTKLSDIIKEFSI